VPKCRERFKQSKKIAAAAIISGVVLSGPSIYANEVENNDVNNNINVTVKEEVNEANELPKEETIEENSKKEEIKEEKQEIKEEKEEVKEDVVIETPKSEGEKEENNKEETSKDYLDQLHYAIEEMRIAVNMMETSDLTNDDNYQRLKTFYKTAIQRIENLEVSSEDKGHIDWIKESAKNIENKMYYIDRVRYEVNRVNTVFDSSRKDTLKNKQIVLDSLGDAVEVGRNYVNSTTLNTAMNMYHELYANWDKELEEAVTQLGYAIEEVREAVNCMNNKDLTIQENYDRMVAFMQAALDRLEGLYVLEGLENYSDHINNLNNNLKLVQDTAKLAKEIRTAMDRVISTFDNNLSREKKIEALDKLGNMIDENRYNINTWTSYTAMELYHQYYALIGEEPENPDIPLIPLEPSIPTNPEEPELPLIPLEPSIPTNPEEPELPLIPLEPSIPTNPEEPELPLTPLEPSIPTNPEKPELPWAPLEPSNPIVSEKPSVSGDKTFSNPENKPSNNSNNPKTGDMSMLGYIGLGLTSIVGLTINKKRK
jgi:tetratricopeptide (TPR) repeat protein